MILSKQKWCLLLTGVSTESQKRTSALQAKRAVLATRSECWTGIILQTSPIADLPPGRSAMVLKNHCKPSPIADLPPHIISTVIGFIFIYSYYFLYFWGEKPVI